MSKIITITQAIDFIVENPDALVCLYVDKMGYITVESDQLRWDMEATASKFDGLEFELSISRLWIRKPL